MNCSCIAGEDGRLVVDVVSEDDDGVAAAAVISIVIVAILVVGVVVRWVVDDDAHAAVIDMIFVAILVVGVDVVDDDAALVVAVACGSAAVLYCFTLFQFNLLS